MERQGCWCVVVGAPIAHRDTHRCLDLRENYTKYKEINVNVEVKGTKGEHPQRQRAKAQ